jgi:RHS repeat-associated protein
VLNADDSAIAYTLYGYSPLGDDPQSQHRFNGYYQELMTGYYPLGNGHRIYSPILMRFFSPDYLSPFEEGGINAYAYCGGDPTNRVDRTGRWFKAIGKFLGIRPNAASNKAVRINSVLNGKPKKYSNSATSFFHNAATKDANLGDPWVGKIRARARDNKLYLTRFVKNDSFEFLTEASIKLHKNKITEGTERLVSVSNLTTYPKNSQYLADIQSALSKSKKGLTTDQLNNIKHEATIIRETSDKYKLHDRLNNSARSPRWPNPSQRDSNYWAEK